MARRPRQAPEGYVLSCLGDMVLALFFHLSSRSRRYARKLVAAAFVVGSLCLTADKIEGGKKKTTESTIITGQILNAGKPVKGAVVYITTPEIEKDERKRLNNKIPWKVIKGVLTPKHIIVQRHQEIEIQTDDPDEAFCFQVSAKNNRLLPSVLPRGNIEKTVRFVLEHPDRLVQVFSIYDASSVGFVTVVPNNAFAQSDAKGYFRISVDSSIRNANIYVIHHAFGFRQAELEKHDPGSRHFITIDIADKKKGQ